MTSSEQQRAPFFQAGTPDRVAAYWRVLRSARRVPASRGRHDPRERVLRLAPSCPSVTLLPLPKRSKRPATVVTPETGNIIRSDIATDARMVWPGPTFQYGNGSMVGRCLRNAPYGVYLRRPGEPGVYYTLAEGTNAGNGLFQRASSMTLLPGDRSVSSA